MQNVKLISAEENLVISLAGEIDSATSEDFYQEVLAIYTHDPKNIVFDCAALEFIDSTTLGTFVKLFKHVRSGNNTFKLVHVRSRIKKLFEICALDRIMEIEE